MAAQVALAEFRRGRKAQPGPVRDGHLPSPEDGTPTRDRSVNEHMDPDDRERLSAAAIAKAAFLLIDDLGCFQEAAECPLWANSGHRCTYSITSLACASSVGGTAIPSALAVLRLITSSYLVGACTGRSAGFSPLRIRST